LPPPDKKIPSPANLQSSLSALKESQEGADIAAWLEAAGGRPESVRLLEAKDQSPVISVGGAIQDSLVSPAKEALRLLEESLPGSFGQEEIWLFGLGGPALLLAALSKANKLTAFEPDPSVARAALSAAPLDPFIRSGKLVILNPRALASGLPRPASFRALVHPSSKRRAGPFFGSFQRLLYGARSLLLGPDGRPSVMVIGPLGGGSEPMGAFLSRAAGSLGLRRELLLWPEKFTKAAESLKKSPDPKTARELLSASSALAARAVESFRPSLVLALAQAPLDAAGVGALRESFPEAFLAFWFVEDFRRFGYVTEVAGAWDLLLHIQEGPFEAALKDLGVSRAMYLPAAADEEAFAPGPGDRRFSSKVSLMGAGYPNRLKIMESAAKAWSKAGQAPEELKIYGSGWERAPKSLAKHLFEGGRRVSAEECALIYRSTEVSLNIHSGPGPGFDPEGLFVNPRTFEVAAAGGFQIVDSRPLLPGLFPEGQLTTIGDPSELSEAVFAALKDPERRRAQAQAARKTTLSKHLYRHRLEAVLKELGGLKNAPDPS
jgi:spore maturation protein CgeB